MMNSEFKLQGSSSSFSSKLDSVFAGLGDLEKKHEDWKKTDSKTEKVSHKSDPVTLRDNEFAIPRSKVQLDRRNDRFSNKKPNWAQERDNRRKPGFLKPQVPPIGNRRIKTPDHKINPDKWTKYSLASVSDSDISDRANTAAAMSFLQEQAKRKSQTEETPATDLRERITFSRTKRLREPEEPQIRVSAGASAAPKHVMPTVTVGGSQKGQKKRMRMTALRDSEEDDEPRNSLLSVRSDSSQQRHEQKSSSGVSLNYFDEETEEQESMEMETVPQIRSKKVHRNLRNRDDEDD